jgi:hypothetical protein
MLKLASTRAFASKIPKFATVDPFASVVGKGKNLIDGEWKDSAKTHNLVDPMTGKSMFT